MFTFTGGTCNEAMGELYDIADDVPHRLQQPVRSVVDFLNSAFTCG